MRTSISFLAGNLRSSRNWCQRIAVIDLIAGRSVAYLEFESGVEELFDVQVLEGVGNPTVRGPFANRDQQTPVWVVPPPEKTEELLKRSMLGSVSRQHESLEERQHGFSRCRYPAGCDGWFQAVLCR